MIALFIAVFAVMLVVAFMIGCGLAEWEIHRKEKDHDEK